MHVAQIDPSRAVSFKMLAELYVPAFHIPLCVRWLRGSEGVVVVDFFKKLPSSGF